MMVVLLSFGSHCRQKRVPTREQVLLELAREKEPSGVGDSLWESAIHKGGIGDLHKWNR